MNDLPALLADYARYHRDARNRRTHYFGVPLISFAVLTALAIPSVSLLDQHVVVAWLAAVALALFYLYADWALGVALTVALALLTAAAQLMTRELGISAALTVATVAFVGGWALQLLGHRLEGNRPALLDNVLQIFVAPLFLAAELAFALGRRTRLRRELARLSVRAPQ